MSALVLSDRKLKTKWLSYMGTRGKVLKERPGFSRG